MRNIAACVTQRSDAHSTPDPREYNKSSPPAAKMASVNRFHDDVNFQFLTKTTKTINIILRKDEAQFLKSFCPL